MKAIKNLVALLCTGAAINAAFAGPATTTLNPCSTTDVIVTDLKRWSTTDSDTAVLNTVASNIYSQSAACVGAYEGNDTTYPQLNLGYAGDGVMNGGSPGTFATTGGVFSQLYTPTDLDGDKNANDPGWIMLGKYENSKFKTESIGNTPGISDTIVLESFFKLKFATVTGQDGKTTTLNYKGTWEFTPDAEVAKRAEELLGKNYFDMFMLVFKSGDAWSSYAITGAQFGLLNPSANDPIYNFYGTWDMSSTLQNCNTNGRGVTKCNPAGLSHLTLYARDPGVTEVPEPVSLALLGIGLMGIAATRRRKA